MVQNFSLTLSEALDALKKGDKKVLASYPQLSASIRKSQAAAVREHEDKITLNTIDIDEMTAGSSVDKFALKRLEVQKGRIERAVEEQYRCAGESIGQTVMDLLDNNDGCAATKAIVEAASLNESKLEDNQEYQDILDEIEAFTEGPNSSKIKMLKETNKAHAESIVRINSAIDAFLFVQGTPGT